MNKYKVGGGLPNLERLGIKYFFSTNCKIIIYMEVVFIFYKQRSKDYKEIIGKCEKRGFTKKSFY